MPIGRLVALLTLALTGAGCLEGGMNDPPAGSDAVWILGGAWTEGYTQADIDAWCEVAREHRNECIVMESHPPQFAMRFPNEAECAAARAKVVALQHITARACTRIQPAGDPDAPVSSSPS